MSRNGRRSDAIAAGVALALLAVLIALRGSVQQQRISVPSTYDTGPRGYAAVYELLAREGVRVTRFEEPLSQLFKHRGVLVVAGDYALARVAQGQTQVHELDAWVRGGGTLAMFGVPANFLHTPLGPVQTLNPPGMAARAGCGLRPRSIIVAGTFERGIANRCVRHQSTLLRVGRHAVAAAYRHGMGMVIVSTTASVLDNEHLAQRANAQFAYAVLSPGPVMFDERIYGYEAGRGFWQVLPLPMRVAIVVALVGVVLALAGANLPFAPPQAIAARDERDSSEYIGSLARMLQRGGAEQAIVQRLCAQMQAVLTSRSFSDRHARELLDRVRMLQSLPGPRAEDLIAAGRLFVRVRKEYGW